LIKLRKLGIEVALSDLDPKVKSLRTNTLKRERELREACLFCYGLACRFEQPMNAIPIEEQDFDFVASWVVDGTRHLAPIQIKELVPEHVNAKITLQEIVDSLLKYDASEELTVAIHLNRAVPFNPGALIMPSLKLAGLWAFGATTPDQSRWLLYGNMLEEPSVSYFDYPTDGNWTLQHEIG